MSTIPSTVAGLRASVVPPHIFLPRGMIIPEEQTLLYLLGRDAWTGVGEIVDAGAFCGASAYAFAAGICDSALSVNRHQRIHSYDLFVVEDDYTREYIQNGFFAFNGPDGAKKFDKRAVIPGESLLEVFRFQTQRYSDQILVRPGSILDHPWTSQPIEVLFIDVAKTLEIQQHLFRSYLPHLLPGGTLIQQDFHHAWHPYIHVAMEYLVDFFDITHSQVGATRAYRLRQAVSQAALRRVCEHDFSAAETAELIARCVERAPPEEQPLLRVVQARQQMQLGDLDAVRSTVRSFVQQWRALPGFDWYASELKAAAGPAAAAEMASLRL